MKKIFMIMATYDCKESSGGSIAHRTLSLLQKYGYRVIVITVGDPATYSVGNAKIVSVPMNSNYQTALLLTRMGVVEDYLSKWAVNVIDYIGALEGEDKPEKGDVALATTVGELGTLKVGYLLKTLYDMEYIVHLHDPIKHADVNGYKYGKFPLPYASREKYERVYLLSADKIITCSCTFKNYLVKKYPQISDKCRNFYFGWTDSAPYEMERRKRNGGQYVIVYGGNFGWPQSPEILAKAAKGLKNIKIVYIGSWQRYKPILRLHQENVQLLPRMSHDKYLEYLIKNVDMGFLSLSRPYFSACIPAKLYEYINVVKPILAAVPDSDSSKIINEKGYGIAIDYNTEQLRDVLIHIRSIRLGDYEANIKNDRACWDFEYTMKGFVEYIGE